ncbi:MAG: DEAD/DEAH box helicase [Candidatus Bathyarchaeia archaeon]|jgi:DEAD/DEAH box helicase domain-containing protein
MDIGKYIRHLESLKGYKQQIVHIEEIPAREAAYGDLDKPLPKCLQDYLQQAGIRLYSHQACAINQIRQGKNVVITTPTASGKTLAFNLPVFEALHTDEKATALYLYPSKALTNDQLKVLRKLEEETGVRVCANVYDGDTPKHQRASIREGSRIILSNPYGLHRYLPWHYLWRKFFQNLKFIVVDEGHFYRGVFGSNVAMLMRRLLRICENYGSHPQIVLSSATIANPQEHAQKLTSKEFEVISNDGSARGKKYFVFWNPPFTDALRALRRSTHQETKDLFVLSISENLQTLCFTVSRQMAELLVRWTREDLKRKRALPNASEAVTAYRAGYLPEERRAIENKLRSKSLIGVASTNALELGIDIGSLDSVIISGYPGTVISTWQQAGRAGRTTADSLVTLVAFQNPLDQYFMKHPNAFFGRAHEQAIIDLHNPYISLGHIMCAAAELPVTEGDHKFFPEVLSESLTALENKRLVRKTGSGWVYCGTARPSEVVNLNNISNKTVTVLCLGKVLETLELTKAYEEAHEGAVLLHQGETYVVDELNLKTLTASVTKKDVSYNTETRKTVDIDIKKRFQEKDTGFKMGLGEVQVTERYHQFVLKNNEVILDVEPLNLPPLVFSSVGMWFTVPEQIKAQVQHALQLDFAGGLHAVEHAMIAMAPLYAMCDRWDIGGVSTPMHLDTEQPTIFIYDGFEGGIGISETLYSMMEKLFKATLKLIEKCECTEGCPSCIYSPKCGNENKPLDKRAAKIILKLLLKELKKKAEKTDSKVI